MDKRHTRQISTLLYCMGEDAEDTLISTDILVLCAQTFDKEGTSLSNVCAHETTDISAEERRSYAAVEI